MQTKSYFSNKNSLYSVNNASLKHVINVPNPGKDIYLNAQKKQYYDEVNRWLSQDVLNNLLYKWDNDYLCSMEEHDELQYRVPQTTNRDIVKELYNDVTTLLYSSGYTIDNINVFKDDLMYFIYRLSDI